MKHGNFKCKVFHNFLIHFTQLSTLEWQKELYSATYTWKEELSKSYIVYLICPVSVCPLWHSRCQVDNPFPPIPTAACDKQFPRWEWWFIFHFLKGICYRLFLPPLPQDPPELRRWIITDISRWLWNTAVSTGRNGYWFDDCCVTNSRHIQHL